MAAQPSTCGLSGPSKTFSKLPLKYITASSGRWYITPAACYAQAANIGFVCFRLQRGHAWFSHTHVRLHWFKAPCSKRASNSAHAVAQTCTGLHISSDMQACATAKALRLPVITLEESRTTNHSSFHRGSHANERHAPASVHCTHLPSAPLKMRPPFLVLFFPHENDHIGQEVMRGEQQERAQRQGSANMRGGLIRAHVDHACTGNNGRHLLSST